MGRRREKEKCNRARGDRTACRAERSALGGRRVFSRAEPDWRRMGRPEQMEVLAMSAQAYRENIDVQAAELLQGAIDMHVHANPHVSPENHMADAVDLARAARDAGMKAMVIKDVTFPTTNTAYLVNKSVSGFRVFGSIVMNLVCGGINPRAVKVAVNHGDGAKVVYFPTGDTLHHVIARERITYTGVNLPVTREQAISVVKNGNLTPETIEVLQIIADADVCMVTGHLSPEETLTLVPRAIDIGVRRIIVLHTMWQMIGFTAEHIRELKKYDVMFEFEFGLCLPIMQFIHSEPTVDPRRMLQTMREIGVEKCIMTTDTGQAYAPSPAATMKYFIAVLLKCGARKEEIERMVRRNPAQLLNL